MDTKLTLKLDKEVIEKAKIYASKKNLSLSRMIESYLQSLTSKEFQDAFEISPFVKSISSGKSLPLDIDYKKEYANHLEMKHK